MPEQNYTPKKYVDLISAFDAGVESGISPLLLPKNQVAIAINSSLRGGFIHPRPAIQKKTLAYGGNTALATLVTTGYFQGGGYYRPDTGTESLIAAISGHLITFTENAGVWNVADVSVPGSLNSATGQQTWMWQAEKWMIVNDGSGVLPIFFNGATSRRSLGDSQLLGTTALNFVVPAQGDSVELTLTSAYTGPLNITVILDGNYYELTQTGNTYPALLTNVNVVSTGTEPAGTQIISAPSNVGYTAQGRAVQNGLYFGNSGIGIILIFTTPVNANIGDFIQIPGLTAQYQLVGIAVSGGLTNYQIGAYSDAFFDIGKFVPEGTLVTRTTTSPSVIVGTTASILTIPAQGDSVTVQLTSAYAGQANQNVYIGSDLYTISPAPQTGQNTLITVINMADPNIGKTIDAGATIMSVPELFAGRMGCYGMGRNWFSSTNGVEYYAGDIVGGGSGTAAYNYRDAVLKMTENDFLSGGGAFTLPGTGDIITAMVFPPVLDTSLGVGSLQIFTPFSVFANNAPADRTTWTNLTWPIQTESLKDQGAMAQNSTVIVNSDVFFRSDFNICSLVLARRQFQLNQWGNKPVADEMERILKLDNQSLLPYGSAVSFDNRYLSACVPNVSPQGIFHSGLISLNFDPLSSLRTNDPPAWEGAWSGINIQQIIVGRVNGMRRCFAFTYNVTTSQIELYELLSEDTAIAAGIYADNGTTPIIWMFESPVMFNLDKHALTELIQLRDGELQVSNIVGTVTIKVYYKPDFYPCWTLWRQVNVCADMSATNAHPTYHIRVGMGEPDANVPNINRPMRVGHFFQFRFEITGYCEFDAFQASAVTIAEPVFSPVNANDSTCQAIDCSVPPDLQIYSLQGLPPQPLPPFVPPVANFKNETVYFVVSCPGGTLDFSGSLPSWITLDQANNQLIGAAGTFIGVTQAAANNAAQTSLNQFGEIQTSQGNLTCGAFACPATGANLAISGYSDGLIAVNEGTAPTDQPIWDGTFKFYVANDCNWFGWQQGHSNQPLVAINNHLCYCVSITFTDPGWKLVVYDGFNEGTLAWSGTISGGGTPVGTYINDNTGYLTTPTTLTVEQISGNATIDNDGPTCALD